MKDNVYKHIELTGTSSKGLQEAFENAVARASKTVRNMRWFEMTDVRGHLDGDKIDQWQVTVKIGLALED